MATKHSEEPGILETDAVLIRTMREEDLSAVVAIDAAAAGRKRPQYFQLMLQRALKLAGLQISLVAELEGRVVGFLIGSLYYGEYGVAEPSASIDAIGVEPRFATLRTEVAWEDFELLAFFKSEGFVPAERLCLECTLDPTTPEP